MQFNSVEFVLFFPFIFCVRYLATWKKMGNVCLLLISYGLYLKWKPVYALVLLWVTMITYMTARYVDGKYKTGKRKHFFVLGIILTLLPLSVFKYFDFLSTQLSLVLQYVGISVGLPGLNWALPLGISFYTFQALGYLSDVYHKRIEAEKNWWDYMLFVSFFPQIASGPISRAKDLLPQIKSERQFNYAQAVQGLKWILWGMFMKVVMADRVGIYADTIFNNYEYQSGLSCWLGSFLYTFQIYGDFAGYSFMAVGVGELLGFELVNNFRRPYLAQSVTEFWHRWHISLSTWLRDYVYIPLGGSRCSKTRNYFNIFLTFLVSGIWHGANWTFIVWGMMHGFFQMIEKMLGLNKVSSTGTKKLGRVIFTFILVDIAWVFFRMPSLRQAGEMVYKMFSDYSTSMTAATVSVTLFIVMSLFIVIVKDLSDEFVPRCYTPFHHKYTIVRWAVYVVLTCLILTCGVFDASQFIYVNF